MSERKFLFLRARDIFLSFLVVAVSVLPVHGETLELGRVSKLTQAEPVSEPQVANSPAVKPVAPEEVKTDSTVNKSSYRLRARDFIRVGVINENDTVIERRINPDGTVDIPFLKQLVPVAGLTITEAQLLPSVLVATLSNPKLSLLLLVMLSAVFIFQVLSVELDP